MDPFPLRCVTFCRHVRRQMMIQKVTTVLLIGTALALAAATAKAAVLDKQP